MKGELSLNDVIHQGPLFLPHLCGILIRSRMKQKVILADVEKAFHMIYLQPTQRDSVRFLWLKDVTKPPIQDNIAILRFCRLPFGINASPFLLGISIKYGIDQQKLPGEAIYDEINENLYVDNVMLTDNSTSSLVTKYQKSKQIFANISMNLRQFITNDEECNEAIKPEDFAKTKTPKILGVPWDHRKDYLYIQCKLQYSNNPTKRKVLQATHSTFDPLGFLTPLLLPAKRFLQDLWKSDYGWDERLIPEHNRMWQTTCEEAGGYIAKVPRMATSGCADDRYELHIFVDASIRSFAAVVYLRTTDSHGAIGSTLLMARQRLAPINNKSRTLTIPRLELLALLIGIRLSDFVIKEIHTTISEIRIYSDSQVTLHWVQSDNKAGVFVDNRCKEIKDKMEGWVNQGISTYLYYIPSELNPADCATKGLNKDQLRNHTWWSGPAFLQQNNEQWPNLEQFKWNVRKNEEEISASTVISLTTLTSTVSTAWEEIFRRQFSKLSKYKKVLALVLKFLKVQVYNKISHESQEKLKANIPELVYIDDSIPLVTCQVADLQSSETILIKLIQRPITCEHFKKWDNLQVQKDEEF